MRHSVELLCVYSHSKEMIVIDLTGIGNTVGTVYYYDYYYYYYIVRSCVWVVLIRRVV